MSTGLSLLGEVPGPERFRELAQAAEALADAIRQAYSGLRASSEEFVRRTGFRLDDAAGNARKIASELRDTARDLDRFAARSATACQIPWGVCPEHGGTLTSTGGRTTCRVCCRTWDYDRIGMPCEEPVRWTLTDSGGDTARICDAHACDARDRLEGARLTRLADSEGEPR